MNIAVQHCIYCKSLSYQRYFEHTGEKNEFILKVISSDEGTRRKFLSLACKRERVKRNEGEAEVWNRLIMEGKQQKK